MLQPPTQDTIMSSRQAFRFTSVLLLLSIFSTVTTAIYNPMYMLGRRQTGDASSCDNYATIANLSTIGSNATYRSAYLAASPEGSDPARAPLDAAIPQLPALTKDVALNEQCGNLTTIAFEEAQTNFTNGIVLQFKINGAPLRIGAGAMGMATLVAMVAVMVADVL
ncbi:hypothetical protein LTR84_001738 [Exophiala bonariae]|uniref:Uncharacterized protein n=1 Tax=Exophiala bonariae TaxID=1690606 RepID=A0AAV9NBJ1_9EURO|nr:hypothetical protein LTR84_001738 [Exophiala bonariae]